MTDSDCGTSTISGFWPTSPPVGVDRTAINILNHLTIICNDASEEAIMDRLLNSSRPIILSFLNQHAFNLALKDDSFYDSLLSSDVLLRDGVGIEICLKLMGRDPGRNLNGTELIPRLIQLTRGRSLAVFGTKEPWLSNACQKISEDGLIVVGKMDGYQDPSAYVDETISSDPDLIILAMGMPRQELLAARLVASSAHPRLIINGGAIIDYMGGRVTRAPKLFIDLRLEWLFRLIREPRRLYGRYVVGGIIFAAHLFQLKNKTANR